MRTRRWSNVFFNGFFAIALAATSGWAGEAVPFTLTVTEGMVDVFDGRGCLLQSLPYAGERFDDANRAFFTTIVDMNFDGFPDIGVLCSQGMQNIYYDCWLWRPDTNGFVKYEDMSEMANLDFIPGTKRVTSFTHVSAISNEESEHAWENGRLVMLSQRVQQQTDDGHGIVVERFERDGKGAMRLVSETVRAIRSGEQACAEGEDDADGASATQGLNLFLPAAADPEAQLDAARLQDGEWWTLRQLPHEFFLLESRRLAARESGEELAKRLIAREWPAAREIATAAFPELSRKLSLPVLKAEFLDGGNEDARQFVAVLVADDAWRFWFVLSAPVDAAPPSVGEDAPVDALERNALLRRDMAAMFLALESGGPEVADSGAAVYETGDRPDGGMDEMTALIRIKKIADPEHGRWLGEGKHAYRYDGVGDAAGKPALLFSFGEDTPEKFTAMRHFAVDFAGDVYEMDVPAGGEYRRLEETPPPWWGEYRAGEAALHIGNYREGPAGMYFICTFSAPHEKDVEMTATVSEREASAEGLTLVLERDDVTVTVTADTTEGGNASGAKWAGTYVRQ